MECFGLIQVTEEMVNEIMQGKSKLCEIINIIMSQYDSNMKSDRRKMLNINLCLIGLRIIRMLVFIVIKLTKTLNYDLFA